LYETLNLPVPTECVGQGSEYILIYGGSTATGIFGIQFAKLSGLRVIATASPHNFDYLRSLGAEDVFDYKAPNVAAEIRAYTNNKLKLAWDCTGLGGPIIAGALSSKVPSMCATIMPIKEDLKATNSKIDGPHVTLMYKMFGEGYHKGEKVEPEPAEYEFAQHFWEMAHDILASGKVKTVTPIVNRGGKGLEGVLKGLDELRGNKISGGKLVYTF
jgi:NADPH:quinone reductase-like Zn-dependent oxidoreductase